MNAPLTASEILRYFQARFPNLKKTGGELRGPCPVHQGKRDSFAVKLETGQYYCHSECNRGGSVFDLEAAISGVEIKTAYEEVYRIVGRESERKSERKSKIVATYDYTDEQGNLLYQCVRYVPKDFKQRRPDGKGDWIWNLRTVRLVLYRLPAVIAAPIVFVVEGEKDADRLSELGVIATCNPMGAGKWRSVYNETLRGKEVIIIPDADAAGTKHVAEVLRSLLGVASSVKILHLPFKDADEWISHGGTLEELIRLADAVSPEESSSETRSEEKASNNSEFILIVRNARDIYNADYPEPKAIVAPILYPGLTLLAGKAKVGKSWLAMQLAIAIAEATKFGDFLPVAEAGRVLYLSLEERERQTRSRLRALTPDVDLLENLDFIHKIPALMTGGALVLDRRLRDHPVDVVIIDSLLGVTKESGRKNMDLMQADYNLVSTLRDIAEHHKLAMVLIAHTRKASADYFVDLVQGTGGITAGADAVWVLSKKPDGTAMLNTTGRDVPDAVFGLSRIEGGVAWKIDGQGEEYTQTEARRELYELLKENGPMKPQTLSKALRRSLPMINKMLHQLCEKGLIYKQKYGLYAVFDGDQKPKM